MYSTTIQSRKTASKSITAYLLVVAALGVLMALGGCTPPGETPSSIADLPAEVTDTITELAVVEEVEILLLESFPVQVQVLARGILPDSCTTLKEAESTSTSPSESTSPCKTTKLMSNGPIG